MSHKNFILLLFALLLAECWSLGHEKPDLPLIDILGQTARYVIIVMGTEDVYQGNPTTLLLADGKTMFCVWSIGRGGHAGPVAVSREVGFS